MDLKINIIKKANVNVEKVIAVMKDAFKKNLEKINCLISLSLKFNDLLNK